MHSPTAFGGYGYDFADIEIATINEEKIDFLLKQALRDRMGDNQNAAYILNIKPKLTRVSLGIGEDDVASRYDLRMSASFDLLDAKTSKSVYEDSVSAISTFAAPRDPYGTISAENNATEQVAREAADRIIIDLASYFESLDEK